MPTIGVNRSAYLVVPEWRQPLETTSEINSAISSECIRALNSAPSQQESDFMPLISGRRSFRTLSRQNSFSWSVPLDPLNRISRRNLKPANLRGALYGGLACGGFGSSFIILFPDYLLSRPTSSQTHACPSTGFLDSLTPRLSHPHLFAVSRCHFETRFAIPQHPNHLQVILDISNQYAIMVL